MQAFVRRKTKTLLHQAMVAETRLDSSRFEAATSELEDARLITITRKPSTVHYHLTIEGWTELGSPKEVIFPDFA